MNVKNSPGVLGQKMQMIQQIITGTLIKRMNAVTAVSLAIGMMTFLSFRKLREELKNISVNPIITIEGPDLSNIRIGRIG
jgi:hypothetical protein